MLTDLIALFLSTLTSGWIDYLQTEPPSIHRPWVVDWFPRCQPGRGVSLVGALIGNLRGRNT